MAEAAIRVVFGSDLARIRFRGRVFAPELGFQRAGLFVPDSRGQLCIGPVFAPGLLMDYW